MHRDAAGRARPQTNEDHGFAIDAAENLVGVGRVGPRSAHLWCRTRKTGLHRIRWNPIGASPAELVLPKGGERTFEVPDENGRDRTAGIRIPAPVSEEERENEASALAPATRYRYRIERIADEEPLGTGTFRTAPVPTEPIDEPITFGFLSCHQPFDEEGAVQPGARQMLRAARTILEQHEARLLFTTGDQIYSDYPRSCNLMDPDYFRNVGPEERKDLFRCSAEEIRRLYQQRYRIFWSLDEWRELLARGPALPAIDDHEIVDNWGSGSTHSTADWQRVKEGALGAYADYQARGVAGDRTPGEEAFDYSVSWGPVSFYVMDLRSHRQIGKEGRLIGESQKRRLERFLAETDPNEVVALVLTVPLVDLPRPLSQPLARILPFGDDLSDRWSTRSHRKDYDWFLRTLFAHRLERPEQPIVLLSGDLHVGYAHRIDWDADVAPVYQLVSSPITHRIDPFTRWLTGTLVRCKRRIATADGEIGADVTLLEGTAGAKGNPYTQRNIGILEVDPSGAPSDPGSDSAPETPPKLAFRLYGHDRGEPKTVFRSGRLNY